jgi:hypothetical protein
MSGEAPRGAPLVFVIDDLLAKPGRGGALLRAYLERYAPGARARGMTLLHQLVSPPYWLQEGSNRLLFVWTVDGPAGAWRMKHTGRQDAELSAWWSREVPELVESRSRAICVDPAEIARLTDV